jgi:multidrug transporter EmrE-like cation transporter
MTATAGVLLCLLVIFELTGDTLAKFFAVTGKYQYLLSGMFFMLIGNVCWQFLLRQGVDLAIGGVLFGVIVAIGLVLIGTLFFGEKLSLIQWAGVVVGIFSIGLLAWGEA